MIDRTTATLGGIPRTSATTPAPRPYLHRKARSLVILAATLGRIGWPVALAMLERVSGSGGR